MTWSLLLIRRYLLFCFAALTIIRPIQIKILVDAPIAELIEGNAPTAVSVYGPEVFPRIRQHTHPLLEQILGFDELLYLDDSVTAGIDDFKGLEIFKSLSKSYKENSKFYAFNVFVFHRHFLFLFRFLV